VRVIFRVDASLDIGTGHVMRCIALAGELKKRKFDVTFITRDIKGHLCRIIKQVGFKNIILQASNKVAKNKECDLPHAHWMSVTWREDAEETLYAIGNEICDWLIVDHYAIDYRWHQVLRSKSKKIMVIDDLANRKLDCDLLLDQNFYLEPLIRYKKLIPHKCLALLGPKYMLLREEFLQKKLLRNNLKKDRVNILVFMGGADFTNETAKVIQALDAIKGFEFHANIIVGDTNIFVPTIRSMCNKRGYITLYQNISNISDLCRCSDIAVGAGGVATLERCFMGLPSLVMLTADNQVETTLALDKVGAIKCIGWHNENDHSTISRAILLFLKNLNILKSMSAASKKIFEKDNFCGVNGIVNIIENVSFSKD